MNKDKNLKKWFFWFSFAVAAIVVFKVLDNFSEIVSAIRAFFNLLKPFILAAVLAYLLYIPCRKIEDKLNLSKIKFIKRYRRSISVFLVYLLIVIIIFLAIHYVFPILSKSVSDLASNIPAFYKEAKIYLEEAPEGTILYNINSTEIAKQFKEMDVNKIAGNLLSGDKIEKYIKGIIGATSIVFDVFVTIVVSVYTLIERKDIKSFFKKLCSVACSEKTYKKIQKYYKNINSIFYNYLSSQILDAIIVATVLSIVMICMKVKYGVLLGVMIGLFNLIPYFGAIVGVSLSVLITVFTGGLSKAIGIAIIAIIIQQIDANIINPKILGNSLKLSPILIIFGVTVGGAYFGILGMLLGAPAVALIKIIIDDRINELSEEKRKQ